MIRRSMTRDPAIRRRPDGSIDTALHVARGGEFRAEKATRLGPSLTGALPSSGANREAGSYAFSRSTLPAR
jgi:hypothetical protein